MLGVEKGAVGASTDLIDDVGLEIAVNGTRDILALTCSWVRMRLELSTARRRLTSLREESAEAMVIVGGFALLSQVAIRLHVISGRFITGAR